MGKLAVIIWGSVVALLLLSASLIPPIGFDKTWWWFWGTFIFLILTGGIGVLVYFVIKRMKNKGSEKEKLEKPRISQEQASLLVDNILLDEFADHFESSEEKVTNEGGMGKAKTPVFHKFGQGYHGLSYYFLLDMTNPTIITKLEKRHDESNEKFTKRINEAISKFAEDPEVFVTEEVESESPEGTKIRRRKRVQSLPEIIHEEEKKAKEEKEEV